MKYLFSVLVWQTLSHVFFTGDCSGYHLNDEHEFLEGLEDLDDYDLEDSFYEEFDDQIDQMGQTGDEYETTAATCLLCYDKGAINCIDSQFTQSVCCDYSDGFDLISCASQYKFCTFDVLDEGSSIFTCPLQNCPKKNKAQ